MTTKNPERGDFAILEMNDSKRYHAVYAIDLSSGAAYWMLEDGRRLAASTLQIKNIRYVRFVNTEKAPKSDAMPSLSEMFAAFDLLIKQKKAPEQRKGDDLWKTVTDAVKDTARTSTSKTLIDLLQDVFNPSTTASPPTPKFPEPTGAGASVRVAGDKIYTRTSQGTWHLKDDAQGVTSLWKAIAPNVEEVLWHGV